VEGCGFGFWQVQVTPSDHPHWSPTGPPASRC